MKRAFLALALVVLSLTAARAADVPIPPPPTRWATDTAGFMSPSALQAADRTLEDFERESGNQVLVWIGPSTGDEPLEDWTIKAFERWKVGRKGLDNGLVLFVFAEDRRARIEVGYGLEGTVPDAVASRILNDVVLPKLRAGDRDGAILDGVNAMRSAISGDAGGTAPEVLTGTARSEGGPQDRPARRKSTLFEKILIGVVALVFLFILITNPGLAMYLLFSILSGGRGGGGGGGGGFSGGGGRGGGGGASGSW